MVARKTSAEAQTDGPIQQAFSAWRRTLWRAHKGAVVGAEAAVDNLDGLRRGSGDPLLHRWVTLLGAGCLITGAASRAAFHPGRLTTEAILLGAGVIGWAIVRRLVLGYLVRRRGGETSRVTAAWSLGLLPLAVSFDVIASAGAWLVSGAVTALALGLFMPKRAAWRLTATTWLVQLSLHVTATLLYWLALNLLVALFA